MNGRELMEVLKRYNPEHEIIFVEGSTNNRFLVIDNYDGFGGPIFVMENDGPV